MLNRNILSAPVVDREKKFVGLLDLRDICAYALKVIEQMEATVKATDHLSWKMMFEETLRLKTAKELMSAPAILFSKVLTHAQTMARPTTAILCRTQPRSVRCSTRSRQRVCIAYPL